MRVDLVAPGADLMEMDALLSILDFSKDPAYFRRCVDESPAARAVMMARVDQKAVGICVVNFASSYPLFKRLNIPEIQDLNVAAGARHQGVGSALLYAAEELARARGHTDIGIGVGIAASYGAAQRLYARRGYIPDGAGASQDDQTVRLGELRTVDDRLCLYLVKELGVSR